MNMNVQLLMITISLAMLFQWVVSDGNCGSFRWSKPVEEPLVIFSVASAQNFETQITTPPFERVPMEVSLYNAGGYYNLSERAFRTPIKGVYSFSFAGAAEWGHGMSLHLFTQKVDAGPVHVVRAMAFSLDTSINFIGGSSASVYLPMDVGEIAFVSAFGDPNQNYSVRSRSDPWGPTTIFSGKLEGKLN